MSAATSGRAYTVEPKLLAGGGGQWVLTLTERGEEMGGGVYPWVVDSVGFDSGYQDALDAGEAWISE